MKIKIAICSAVLAMVASSGMAQTRKATAVAAPVRTAAAGERMASLVVSREYKVRVHSVGRDSMFFRATLDLKRFGPGVVEIEVEPSGVITARVSQRWLDAGFPPKIFDRKVCDSICEQVLKCLDLCSDKPSDAGVILCSAGCILKGLMDRIDALNN